MADGERGQTGDTPLGLAEAIEAVRGELLKAQETRLAGPRFIVGPVEVELAVDVTKTRGGKVGVNVLSVFVFDGERDVARQNTHRVTVTLTPVGAAGEPYEVSSERGLRPDGPLEEHAGLGQDEK